MKLSAVFVQPKLNVTFKAPSFHTTTGMPVARDYVKRPAYEGPYSVTPSNAGQTLETDGLLMSDDVTVAAMPNATISPSTNVTANPTLTVNYETGEISASVSKTQSVNVVTEAGYAPVTSHSVAISGNAATQLITHDSSDLIQTGSTVTAPAGYYPSNAEAIVPYLWRGEEVELVKAYTTESAFLSATDFNTWSPSTTAYDIVASSDLGTQSIDTEHYEYIVNWQFYIEPVYSGATNKARTVKAAQNMFYYIVRRPSNLTNIESGTNNYNVAININTPGILDYYNSSSSHTLTWSVSYGIYMTAVAPTFANSTNYSTTLTIKKPKITARCSTTYLSTSNCGKIVKTDTKYYLKCYFYRCKAGSYPFSIYQDTIALYNNGLS